jgi:hypothetical protein
VADTGLPWELPYPLPTDLVRDGADAIKDLAEATADGLDDASLIKQVVSVAKLDTFSTTSASFTAVTGMSATITPSAATNKVLVICQFNSGSSGTNFYARVTGGNAGTYVGGADGSRVRVATESAGFGDTTVSSGSIVYLDSPSSTSATTYQLEIARGGVTAGTVHVNRSNDDGNNTNRSRGASSITLIEVAA